MVKGNAGKWGRSVGISGRRKISEPQEIFLRPEIPTLRPHFPFQSFTSSDGTKKFLVKLDDGESVESVLIPRHDRSTLCISSQVGCGLGCTFCLTGRLGFTRDLTTDEIISQVLLMLSGTTQRFSVVFMGMGEPLQNY